VRLNLSPNAAGGRRRQLLLPIPWEPDQVDTIRDAVLTLFEAFREGVDLQEALERIPAVHDRRTPPGVSRPHGRGEPTTCDRATPQAPDTPRASPALVEIYREHKLRSGEVKPATWNRMYRPRMDLLLRLLAGDSSGAPVDSTALFHAIAAQWAAQPGCRTRQLQVQSTAAMLRWLLQQGFVGEEWSPPQDLAPFIGRARQLRTITTPMAVEHILAMLEAIPDVLWWLCFQLIAAYGLRPEEIQHLERRNGRLWCLYEKVAARGKTKPRPLRLLPCDQWAAEWNLEGTYRPSLLPPMRPGHGAQDTPSTCADGRSGWNTAGTTRRRASGWCSTPAVMAMRTGPM
jgi:hypothetical protein